MNINRLTYGGLVDLSITPDYATFINSPFIWIPQNLFNQFLPLLPDSF